MKYTNKQTLCWVTDRRAGKFTVGGFGTVRSSEFLPTSCMTPKLTPSSKNISLPRFVAQFNFMNEHGGAAVVALRDIIYDNTRQNKKQMVRG